jgi:hypothetical protein
LLVYGFGEQKTPSAFVSACDKFIFTEVLREKTDENEAIDKKSSNELKQDTRLVRLLRNAVDASSDETDGLISALLAAISQNRRQNSIHVIIGMGNLVS